MGALGFSSHGEESVVEGLWFSRSVICDSTTLAGEFRRKAFRLVLGNPLGRRCCRGLRFISAEVDCVIKSVEGRIVASAPDDDSPELVPGDCRWGRTESEVGGNRRSPEVSSEVKPLSSDVRLGSSISRG